MILITYEKKKLIDTIFELANHFLFQGLALISLLLNDKASE